MSAEFKALSIGYIFNLNGLWSGLERILLIPIILGGNNVRTCDFHHSKAEFCNSIRFVGGFRVEFVTLGPLEGRKLELVQTSIRKRLQFRDVCNKKELIARRDRDNHIPIEEKNGREMLFSIVFVSL